MCDNSGVVLSKSSKSGSRYHSNNGCEHWLLESVTCVKSPAPPLTCLIMIKVIFFLCASVSSNGMVIASQMCVVHASVCVYVSCSVGSDSLRPMNCSPPGSPVHGIFQARILGRVAISYCRGASLSRAQTQFFSIAGRFFTIWATREALRCGVVLRVSVKSLHFQKTAQPQCQLLLTLPFFRAFTKLSTSSIAREWMHQIANHCTSLTFNSVIIRWARKM